MIKTYVEIKLNVEGFHLWADAFQEVSFLRDKHRHIFVIRARKEVFHDDRDIEFIMFKREVKDFLVSEYWSLNLNAVDFNTMSCESIAKVLIDKFTLSQCSVHEDDENGAIVIVS